MEGRLMKDVEQEIQRILNKNKLSTPRNDYFCNEKNIEKCLKEISQEFDYFDVSCMEEENFDLNSHKSLRKIIVNLVNSSYNLIKLYRETQKQQNDTSERNSRLYSDFTTASKTVESLKKELAKKDAQLQLNKEKMAMEKFEKSELGNKIKETKKEMTAMQKDILTERSQHKNEINKVMLESRILQERFSKNYGEYVSNEHKIVDVIDSFKTNEEKHLKMIEKLQENNHLLLEEILALKGELAEASFKHRNK